MALFVSSYLIELDGVEASESFQNDVLQVCVEESLHLPGMFTLVLNNPYAPGDTQTTTWEHQDLIKIGTKIRLGFEASTSESDSETAEATYIMNGEITGIETHFTSSTQAPILVRGYDISHRLHRGKFNRSFQDVSDRDLVEKLAEETGIELGEIKHSEQRYPYLFQQNQSNMAFLRQRAARIGFELYVRDGKLNFCPPGGESELELTWMQNLTSFRVRVTTAEQVDTVEVRGWDYHHKEPIVAVADRQEGVITTTNMGNGSDHTQAFHNSHHAPKMTVVDRPVKDREEAQAIAKALFDRLEGEFIHADARAIGNPEIRVGRVVSLSNMGDYDGKYYVTETRHLFYQGEYQTEFAVRGLKNDSLLQLISSPQQLQPSQTMLVGIVTDNQDPEGLGRVRVKFPTLNPETDGSGHESWWARLVGIGAGKERGWYCLPEINDEVLVAFEHGDIHRPYIIGGVWNGVDAPPEPTDAAVPQSGPHQGKVRLRTFKTRSGHSLQFVENDLNHSRTGVYLQTNQGQQLRLNDSDRCLEIETANKSRIRLDDHHRRIEIVTQDGHLCCLDDASKTIQIQSTGAVNIKAAGSINLSPTLGQVAVSGLISCPSLLAGSLMFGSSLTESVDIMQSITALQAQIESISDELSQLQTSSESEQTEDLIQT